MKKILFSAIVIATSLTAFSQVNGRIAKSGPSLNTPVIIDQPSINSSLAISCTTLTTLSSTSLSVGGASSDTTTPGCSPNAGYVYGNNCYGDKEKANFFAASSYSLYTGANVTSVIVGFFQSGTEGTGGVSTHTVGMTLYNGTNVTTAPGTAIGSTVATLGAIAAAHTGTTNVFYYTFNFAAPLTAPTTGGFYASLVLPTAAGDTAVVANQTSAPANKAWEKWSDDSWNSIATAWGTNGNLLILPILCGTYTSISENLGLSNNVKVLPNPTSGLVNVVFTLANEENVVVSVSNTLGQVVSNSKFDGISNKMVSLDIANQPNGVYFVTISNGKDKMVQRLILNK